MSEQSKASERGPDLKPSLLPFSVTPDILLGVQGAVEVDRRAVAEAMEWQRAAMVEWIGVAGHILKWSAVSVGVLVAYNWFFGGRNHGSR